MKKGEKDKLTDFVRGVMSHKTDPKDRVAKDKAIRESAKSHQNDKFIWKEGDLVIEESTKKEES